MLPLRKYILDALFPVQCLGCNKPETLLCGACFASIPVVAELIEKPSEHLDFIVICGHYEHPLLKTIIKNYKYQGLTSLAGPLARLLSRGIGAYPLQQEPILVPIPLHWRKKNARGYNQSELLALELVRARGLAINTQLKRIRGTRSQSKLSRTERLKNVVNIFLYPKQYAPAKILLIDDITTTFSTLESAAKELKRCGADSVGAVVLAKNDF